MTYFIDSCGSCAAIDFVKEDSGLKDRTAVVAACRRDQCAHGCLTGTVLTGLVQNELDRLRKGTTEPANAKDVVSQFAQKVLVRAGDDKHPPQYIDTEVYVPDGWKGHHATDLPFWNGFEKNQEDNFDIIFTKDRRRHSSSRLVCHYN